MNLKKVIIMVASSQIIKLGYCLVGILLLAIVSTRPVLGQMVTGHVTDSQSAEILPSVNIAVKGSTNGTFSDGQGNYSLSVESLTDTLIVSFVGYQTQQVPLDGRKTVNIEMQTRMLEGEELVVTAFGIKQKEEKLSYSTEAVKGEEVNKTGNNSFIQSLEGKVAGVSIRQVSGAPGSQAKITIRGNTSISGNNTPLFVVDGFTVSGNVAEDIDPNNIESVNILKGSSAAALYGLRASNGVVLISTKNGANNHRLSIDINTKYKFERLSLYPKTQRIYGQGLHGEYAPTSSYSWGPKISEMGTYTNQFGEKEIAQSYDNARDFFQVGAVSNSNINISNNFDEGNYSLGLGYQNNEGIVPNTDFSRVNVNLNGDYKISSTLSLGTIINYSNHQTHGTNTDGGDSDVFYAAFNVPPTYNLKGKSTHVAGNEYQQINFRGKHDNIYWNINHNKMIDRTSSLIGGIHFDYDPTNWLNFTYRLGIDDAAAQGEHFYDLGSGATGGRTDPPSGGSITASKAKRLSLTSNIRANIEKDITEKLNFDLLVGHEFYNLDYRTLNSSGNDFTIGGFDQLSNANSVNTSMGETRKRSYSLYGKLNLGYDELLFLNLTGRNDVVSNMPRNHRSFFYPSVGLSFVFTKALHINPDVLSFGKIRVSYAEVGQAADVYSTKTTFQQGGAFSFPFEGVNGFTLANTLKSNDLRPENTQTKEIGFNLGFLNNRINLDYSYYYEKSKGQIFSVPIANSTGFSSELRNAGVLSNYGHEIVFDVKPIQNKIFSWDFKTNFSTYVNKVEKLAKGVNILSLGGSRVDIVAKKGKEYPTMRGTGYARDPQSGEIVVDSREILNNGDPNPNYGMPLETTGDIDLGKVNPDFEIGFMNTFKYKNITLYAQLDWKHGGQIYSGATRLAKLYGTYHDTKYREQTTVLSAQKGYYDSNGELKIVGKNDIAIHRGYQYYRVDLDPNIESNIYDASYLRLREIKISYDMPIGFLKRFDIVNASVSLIGHNLWLIKSGLPYYDPEMDNTSGNGIGSSYTQYPQTSTYGIGIDFKF